MSENCLCYSRLPDLLCSMLCERRDDVGCRVLPDSPDPARADLRSLETSPADAIPFSSAGALSASTNLGDDI